MPFVKLFFLIGIIVRWRHLVENSLNTAMAGVIQYNSMHLEDSLLGMASFFPAHTHGEITIIYYSYTYVHHSYA